MTDNQRCSGTEGSFNLRVSLQATNSLETVIR